MIALLPAGSAESSLYPPRSWWTRLVRALGRELPEASVYVTGVSESHAGRTATSAFPRAALEQFVRAGNVVDCYDIGLWNQAAVIEMCDVLIAPHTGFAFLAPCVGTPWLAVSGGRWIEYFFNGVPFYSVLPDCPRYPCHSSMKSACVARIERGRPVLCMEPRALTPRIPEVVAAVQLLLDPGFTYERAVAQHQERMDAAGVTRKRLWSFDGAVPYPPSAL